MSSKTKQKKSAAAKNVLIFFIVFIILEMLIVVGLSLLFKNKDSTPSVAGYSFYIMKSDAMGDAVPKGSLVVASNGTPNKEKISSAILCKDVPGIGTSVFWLDSIESKEGQDGVTYNIFQKNDPDTKYSVKSSNIVGLASTYYKTAGKVISFVTSTLGMVICAAVPLFLLILIELIIAIVRHSSSDEYYDDDDYYDDEYDDDEYDDGYDDGYDDEPEMKVKSKDRKDKKNNSVQLDDFLFGSNKEAEQIAKRHGKRPDARDDREFSNHKIDNSYYEEATKMADTTQEVPKQIPKTRPASQPVRRPAPQQRTKSSDNSIEDLMKMMDEEQEKLRNKMDN